MIRIIQTEWLKIRRYPAFWWLLGITALTYPGINYMFLKIYEDIVTKKNELGAIAKSLLGNPFALPEGWRTMAYFSSFFVFIPAIIIIMLITNEFSYKTNRQNIIDGWSRKDFMLAKMIDVVIISLLITLLYTGVALVIGLLNTEAGKGQPFAMVHYIGLFALQTFSQLSLAFLVGLLVRRSFIALAIFVFYFIIVEPIAINFLKFRYKSGIGEYFPLELSDRLLPQPAFLGRFNQEAYQKALDSVNPHILYTILLVAITWWICFRIYSRRDL